MLAMRRVPAPLALLLLAAPLAAQSVAELSLEQRMLLRCSAAFAMGAERQASGTAPAADWPPLAARGESFFLRAVARVMDEAGLDRPAITAALGAEANDIAASGTLAQVLAACLPLLPPD